MGGKFINLNSHLSLSVYILFHRRIRLQISHEAAACITALRAAMEALVVEVSKQPNIISQLDPVNEHMLNTIRQISRPSAAGINLMIGSVR